MQYSFFSTVFSTVIGRDKRKILFSHNIFIYSYLNSIRGTFDKSPHPVNYCCNRDGISTNILCTKFSLY